MADLFVVAHGRFRRGSLRKRWELLEDRLRQSIRQDVEVRFTNFPGEARQIAADGLRAGALWLIAAGGDGTANEVANAIFESGRNKWPNISFSVLPCGSANDFARTLGIAASGLLAVDSLARFRETRVDVGWAEFVDFQGDSRERAFLNVAECGVGAAAVDRLRNLPHARTGYLAAALFSVFTHRLRPYDVTLEHGVPAKTAPSLGVIVSNGRYFGAGIPCAPHADPHDGLLDVVTLGGFGRIEVLRKIHLLLAGKHLREEKVSHRTARSVQICCPVPTPFEMDGEPAGFLPARIRVLPSALRVRF